MNIGFSFTGRVMIHSQTEIHLIWRQDNLGKSYANFFCNKKFLFLATLFHDTKPNEAFWQMTSCVGKMCYFFLPSWYWTASKQFQERFFKHETQALLLNPFFSLNGNLKKQEVLGSIEKQVLWLKYLLVTD